MADDIVDRLHRISTSQPAVANEAADEINRLRESVIEAQQHRHAAECNLEAAHATVMRLREALADLVACHDEFLASDANQQEAYYKLAKYARPKWDAARAALAGDKGDSNG